VNKTIIIANAIIVIIQTDESEIVKAFDASSSSTSSKI
jgi:hypothetical protein